MPMKRRMMYRPVASLISGAKPMGMLPISRIQPKTLRGPNWSHSGPATKRTPRVATRDTMLELATCSDTRPRSFLMVTVN